MITSSRDAPGPKKDFQDIVQDRSELCLQHCLQILIVSFMLAAVFADQSLLGSVSVFTLQACSRAQQPPGEHGSIGTEMICCGSDQNWSERTSWSSEDGIFSHLAL